MLTTLPWFYHKDGLEFFSKIREDICCSSCTTGVVDTSVRWQMKKKNLQSEKFSLFIFSINHNSSLGRYVFGSEISYNKAPPRLPGLGC